MVNKRIDGNGSIRYFNEQVLLHREDGPAIECTDGYKAWYINGKCHRVDGPAIKYTDGYKSYFIMGKEYSYKEWLAIKDFPLLW